MRLKNLFFFSVLSIFCEYISAVLYWRDKENLFFRSFLDWTNCWFFQGKKRDHCTFKVQKQKGRLRSKLCTHCRLPPVSHSSYISWGIFRAIPRKLRQWQEINKGSPGKSENVFFLFHSLVKVRNPEWVHTDFNVFISPCTLPKRNTRVLIAGDIKPHNIFKPQFPHLENKTSPTFLDWHNNHKWNTTYEPETR